MPKDKPYPWESKAEADIRISNAMERTESYQLGGQVRPPTAPSISPTPQYKEGGFVKKAVEKYKSKKAEKKREKARKKAVEDFPITGIVKPKPKKKSLKTYVVPSNPPLFKGDTAREKIIHAIPGLSKTPAGKRALEREKHLKNKNKKTKNKMQKVAPKGGHPLEPVPVTKGRKKKKQLV